MFERLLSENYIKQKEGARREGRCSINRYLNTYVLMFVKDVGLHFDGLSSYIISGS